MHKINSFTDYSIGSTISCAFARSFVAASHGSFNSLHHWAHNGWRLISFAGICIVHETFRKATVMFWLLSHQITGYSLKKASPNFCDAPTQKNATPNLCLCAANVKLNLAFTYPTFMALKMHKLPGHLSSADSRRTVFFARVCSVLVKCSVWQVMIYLRISEKLIDLNYIHICCDVLTQNDVHILVVWSQSRCFSHFLPCTFSHSNEILMVQKPNENAASLSTIIYWRSHSRHNKFGE